MRLSWYSNTGIAVFSIWQGGTCTGTFRLPVDDLTRLVDSLRRGAPGGQDESSGPIALGGQRPRLAIGAAPAEPFTGMMTVLTDERAAAYGRPNGRQTGGFAAAGTDSPRNGYGNGAGQASLSDYAASAQGGGTGDRYGTGSQYNGTGAQYNGNGSRFDANGSEYSGAGSQYGAAREYAGSDSYGSGQQYDSPDQYGTADRRGTGSQYAGPSGYGDTGYGEASYADTDPAGFVQQGRQPGTGQPSGFGAAAQYPAQQQGESAPSYSTGPQPSYGFQSPTGQSYGDSQAGSQAHGGQPGGAQPGGGQPSAGFMFQSGGGAPEESHGDETGPRPVARYADQAGYGQPGAQSFQAQSFDVQAYESRRQESPSPAAESYDRAYGGQGYGQQQAYQQPVYDHHGYDDHGYDDQGYAAPGRAEQAPAGLEFPAGSFGSSGYTTPGQDAGPAPGGQAQYQEYGYGQQDQRDTAAQARGQQGFAAQPPAAGPRQWQDAERTNQPGTAQGYQSDSGGTFALSAPLPDNGGGQQSPGAAQAQAAAAYPGRPGGSYGAQAPQSERYAASYGEQQGHPRSPGYQAQTAQPDAARYQGAALADGGNGAGGAATSGYAAGTSAQGYQSAAAGTAGSYGYDQPGGYNGSGNAGGYGESDRGGTGSFPAGYSATSAPGTGVYPEAAGANGYAADGYASNGYATNGYQANGYAAGGSGASDYPAAGAAGQGSAPSGAYPRVPANGYAAGYADGLPGNGTTSAPAPSASAAPSASTTPSANDGGYAPGAPRPAAQPTFTPTFTAHGSADSPAEADGTGRPGQPADAGYVQAQGYGTSPAGGGPQAYQSAPAYPNGNGVGYPTANGNGYAASNGNGYAANPNENGHAASNGTAQANGYQHDDYPRGQSTGPLAADYQPAPGYAPADQADQTQQAYWDQEQQPRGNWT